ncbi:hypothetical protein [Methylobacterium frigidaeris]|uniref:Uncharacterized protein n=1 Tax=Methylobacterium frigidaeris TaxID=2038277 RepID=A0AA37M6A0_9HYPH|nr:hypothetical protein [Methylobacterium frigidaeris]GJD63789.1 hypothetical protein MPEAHAMD_3960 [Methylobacterium frigidaeris]
MTIFDDARAEIDAVEARIAARQLMTCKHWRGPLGQPPCGAGVDVVARAGPRRLPGWVDRVPCRDAAFPAFTCDLKMTPTSAEIEESKREAGEAFSRVSAVMRALPADKSIAHGEVPCPKCAGPVRWERSPVNGHVRAACAEGCVSFIQ